jgi:HAD superfamily hydrolase (TIGR01490 family)
MNLAVFDLDKTLYRGYSSVEFVYYLHELNLFNTNALIKLKDLMNKLKQKKIPYLKTAHNYCEILALGLKNKKKSTIVNQANKFFNKNNLYTFSKPLIELLKKNNYYILILSNSLEELLLQIKKYLDADKIIGIDLETKDDYYTGKINSEIHLEKGKQTIINKFIRQNNFSIKNSFGFGDSEHDIGFLNLVENPIVFEPRKNLRKYALKNNWTIVNQKNIIKKVKNIIK